MIEDEEDANQDGEEEEDEGGMGVEELANTGAAESLVPDDPGL